jgi:hypothetical protein
MGAATKMLYETDFAEWTERTAALLRAGRFTEVDIEHAAGEIEDLGRSAAASQLKTHAGPSREAANPARTRRRRQPPPHLGGPRRDRIPSRRFAPPPLYAEKDLQKIYRRAVCDARVETGLTAQRDLLDLPADRPYTLEDLTESD